MSDSMGTREASRKWDCTQAQVSKLCRDGLIEGAEQDKKGSPWHIPKNAKCPKLIKNK